MTVSAIMYASNGDVELFNITAEGQESKLTLTPQMDTDDILVSITPVAAEPFSVSFTLNTDMLESIHAMLTSLLRKEVNES